MYLDPCFSFNSLTVSAILSSNCCLFDGRGSLRGGALSLQPHDDAQSEESSEFFHHTTIRFLLFLFPMNHSSYLSPPGT